MCNWVKAGSYNPERAAQPASPTGPQGSLSGTGLPRDGGISGSSHRLQRMASGFSIANWSLAVRAVHFCSVVAEARDGGLLVLVFGFRFLWLSGQLFREAEVPSSSLPPVPSAPPSLPCLHTGL